ncbi:Uncharacterised protein [Helicobacter pametensis]|nr:Uncharacterised protein [Helicobacter pametensis]
MRTLLGFLCCFYFIQAEISKESVQISTSKDTLQITLPTQAKFTPKQNPQEITLTINESWAREELNQHLSYPFKSLQIKPNGNQTLLILKAQTDLSYAYSQDSKGLHLTFWVDSKLSWWRYGLAVGILIALITFLLYLKRRQKTLYPHHFKMTQNYLSKDCKIITLNNEEKTFVIFSNDKGCILLESKEHKKDFMPKED